FAIHSSAVAVGETIGQGEAHHHRVVGEVKAPHRATAIDYGDVRAVDAIQDQRLVHHYTGVGKMWVQTTGAGVDAVGHHNFVTRHSRIYRILNVRGRGDPVGVGRRGVGVVDVHVAHGGQGAARGRQEQQQKDDGRWRMED